MRHHLRIARGTNRLDAVVTMYCDGLGFEVLGRFEDHDGFDGVMLGHAGAEHHLEFTTNRAVPNEVSPGPDDLLVFYVPEPEWVEACARAEGAGFVPVAAVNPYWDRSGATFTDVDGHRVVLQAGEWPLNPSE
jgi:hypothetical protein